MSIKVGRPRAFNDKQALQSATDIFWTKGYEGASLSDLTDAMGINRPSLYAAFGNKEALYAQVLDIYMRTTLDQFQMWLNHASINQALENWLLGSVQALTQAENPKGCLTVQGIVARGDDTIAIQRLTITARDRMLASLQQRINRAITEGDLPADVDAKALARYFMVQYQGMAIQSISGATTKELEQLARCALQILPESKGQSEEEQGQTTLGKKFYKMLFS